MKILVLGANGMFGNVIFSSLDALSEYQVTGTVRKPRNPARCMNKNVVTNLDVLDQPALEQVINSVSPEVIINCTGLIKQRPEASDPLKIIPINGLFPHSLSMLCRDVGARLIQFSTDCVFSGDEGNYSDDAELGVSDLYGMSKYLGEVREEKHVLTLRTSIIGHELQSNYQLVNWFLSQQNSVYGYTNAIFSGFPTIEIADILHHHVLSGPALHGLYNLSANPISKHDLLKLIRQVYGKDIDIIADGKVQIDRSLNSDRFRKETGYIPPDWQTLVEKMYKSKQLPAGN